MLLLTIAFFSIFRNAAATSAYTDIDAQAFHTLLAEGNVTVIDVRSPREVAKGIIDDAILINYFDSDFEQKVSALPKDKKYILYCRSGRRSADGCKVMHKHGFTNLFNLKGGYQSWLRSK